MTLAEGFAEANVAKPEAPAKHVFAVVRWAGQQIFLRAILLIGKEAN